MALQWCISRFPRVIFDRDRVLVLQRVICRQQLLGLQWQQPIAPVSPISSWGDSGLLMSGTSSKLLLRRLYQQALRLGKWHSLRVQGPSSSPTYWTGSSRTSGGREPLRIWPEESMIGSRAKRCLGWPPCYSGCRSSGVVAGGDASCTTTTFLRFAGSRFADSDSVKVRLDWRCCEGLGRSDRPHWSNPLAQGRWTTSADSSPSRLLETCQLSSRPASCASPI